MRILRPGSDLAPQAQQTLVMKSLTAMPDSASTSRMWVSSAVRRGSGQAARVRVWNLSISAGRSRLHRVERLGASRHARTMLHDGAHDDWSEQALAIRIAARADRA